jgi:zinc/manganese transport system substrate-binding protein
MNFNIILQYLIALTLGLGWPASSITAAAALDTSNVVAEKAFHKVVTTLPELEWLVREIGKPHFEVTGLLRGNEDPHSVAANPRHVLELSKADLVCQIGLSLESAWLQRAITRARNPKLKTDCIISDGVSLLGEILKPIDRSMGHLHAEGNPHFWLSLMSMRQAADEVHRQLLRLRPDLTTELTENKRKLQERLDRELALHRSTLLTWAHLSVAEYHDEFAYFLRDYSMRSRWTLEEIPGQSPSSGRIASQSERARKEQVNLLIASKNSDRGVLEKFSRASEVPFVQLRTQMLQGEDFIEHHRALVSEIKAILSTQPNHER